MGCRVQKANCKHDSLHTACLSEHHVQLALIAEGPQDTLLSATAWVVVLAATAASFLFMSKAFSEAKSAIERRQERQQAKQEEDEQKETQRQEKLKKMFERL